MCSIPENLPKHTPELGNSRHDGSSPTSVGAAPQDAPAKRKGGRLATACKECRRLKSRCDGLVPCSTCLKKGCPEICPDGTKAKRNREAEALQLKNQRLEARIRELEASLHAARQEHSSGPPPPNIVNHHLADTTVPGPVADSPLSTDSDRSMLASSNDVHEEDSLIEAFGTLNIGPVGEAVFLGRNAMSEYLVEKNYLRCKPFDFPHFSERLRTAARREFHVDFVDHELADEIFGALPSKEVAIMLCDFYIDAGKYLWHPITREELMTYYVNPLYEAESYSSLPNPYILSGLLSCLALGMLGDFTREGSLVEAQELYLLACISLTISPLATHKVTLEMVQTFIHLAWFENIISPGIQGPSRATLKATIALKLGHTIGLHLNGSRWSLCSDYDIRRSNAFWSAFLLDTWLNFTLGRPPTVSPAFIDCALPPDTDPMMNTEGILEMSYNAWLLRYTIALHDIITSVFSAKVPKYSKILASDMEIRKFPVPEHLRPMGKNCPLNEVKTPKDLDVIIQTWNVLSCKETVLLAIHRCYFAQALQDCRSTGQDILSHKFGPSVIASYRSAWRLIECFQYPIMHTLHMLRHMYFAWSQAVSGAIVMCLLVTCAPYSNMAPSAFEQLKKLTEMFEKTAPSVPVAAYHLDTIQRLKQRAEDIIKQPACNHPQYHYVNGEYSAISDTEIERWSGKTHLIHNMKNAPEDASSTINHKASPDECAAMTISPDTVPQSNLHPTIIEDMRAFDGVHAWDPSVDHLFDSTLPANIDILSWHPAAPIFPSTSDATLHGFGLIPQIEGLGDFNLNFNIGMPTLQSQTAPAPAGSSYPAAEKSPRAPTDDVWFRFMSELGLPST